MALRDQYDPDDLFVDRFIYAVRHAGPDASTPLGGGKKMGRKATNVRHVLRELAVYAVWESGDNCFPRQERIAEAVGMTRQTVTEAIQAAIATGWLEARKRPVSQRSGRNWAGNIYRLCIPPEAQERLDTEELGRRESRHAESSEGEGVRAGSPDGRRESRRARSPGRRVFVNGGRRSPDGRRESRRELVGKADTNLSGEPSTQHSRELRAHPREVVSLSKEEPPAGWEATHELQGTARLFPLLDEGLRRWVHTAAFEREGVIAHHRELGYLDPADLRRLQFHLSKIHELETAS